MMVLDDELSSRLAKLEADHLRRWLRPLSSGPGPRVVLDGREVLQFCSNDYLGLAADPRLGEAATEAIARFCCGAGSSRLVGGTTSLHADLEDELANLKSTEAALLFTSGYQANLGVLSALVGEGDTIFSDARNHASLIDGCRLSRARVVVYRHCDVTHLDALLASTPSGGRRLVVTETVFSMDGDVAPLRALVDVAHVHGAMTLVDEAHAIGVFGERGGGVVEAEGLVGEIDVQVGTLGKALGCLGAFVAGSRAMIDLLTNTARTFVYTTALAPPMLAAARKAVTLVTAEPERRRRLWRHAEVMRTRLGELGYHVGTSASPILPLLVGDDERALCLSAALLERGVLVPAIRPPTVPSGTARLRVVPMATHQTEDLEIGLAAFASAGRATGVLSS